MPEFICNECGHEFVLSDWDMCPECESDEVDEVSPPAEDASQSAAHSSVLPGLNVDSITVK